MSLETFKPPKSSIEKKEVETFFDKYGIERIHEEKNDKKLKLHFYNVIDKPEFFHYFNINKHDSEKIIKVYNFYKMLELGIEEKEIPKKEDMLLYQKTLNLYLESFQSSPNFIDKIDEEMYIFCMDYRYPKKALKIADKYYLLEDINIDTEEILNRVAKLNNIKYFPDTQISNIDGRDYLLREYIPKTNTLPKNIDVSDFVNKCKKINFGPDTNYTNFLEYNNQLYYIDQDYIDWINNPEKHKFDTEKTYIKNKTF